MVLNRGTILGSTKDRIQIASKNGKYLPGDDSTDPIVLQGKYVQLLNYNGANVGPRGYVQTYDASYGHVYPIAGSFTDDQIGTSDSSQYSCAYYAQFYKYSNDPAAVTANDTVKVATTSNVTLSGLYSIDGVSLVEGDYVLVRNQSTAQYNGIYRANSSTWTRAGGYMKWSSFIGKVIFVEQGQTYGQSNFISQARAGGELYTGSGTVTDFSPLAFAREQPVLLFPNLVEGSVTYYIDDHDYLSTVIDGCTVLTGDTVLCGDNHKIMSYTGSGWTELKEITSSTVKYRVLYGQTYGGRYVSYNGSSDFYADANTAIVLKNTTTQTYIKPYIGLDTKMAIYFTNNQTVTYADSSIKNYLSISAVDTKL